MLWKFTGDRPVYLQIVAAIQGAVLSGEYPPGSRIPSVRDLAAEARVNPNTMQRALMELEHQNILIGGGTAGRWVTADAAILEQVRAQRLNELARECAGQFEAYGISPRQAAALIAELEDKEE